MEHVLVNGECATCGPGQTLDDEPAEQSHVLDDGVCTTCTDNEPLDEDSAALLQALNELDGPAGDAQRAAFDPTKHLRNPKGSPGGGRFRSNVDKLKDAIAGHKAGTYDGHPFDSFSREQLRKVAKARGIELKRGESKESISEKLLGHLGESDGKPAMKPVDAPDVKGAIRDAYAAHATRNHQPVRLSKIRENLGGHSRENVDAALVDMYRKRDINLTREANQKTLTGADLAAAVDVGGEPKHNMSMPLAPSKAPARPPKPATKQAALDAAPVKLGTLGSSFERGDGDPTALAYYRGHGYVEINAQLRDGRALSADRKADWAVERIDAVMAESALTRDIQVHRGVGDLGMFGPAGRSGKSLVGMEYVDKAYASATADPNVAREFWAAEGQGAILNIRIPAGTGAIQLSGLGPKPRHHWEFPRPPETEAELLLQRGLTYRVVGDRVVNGARQLDVEVVPA